LFIIELRLKTHFQCNTRDLVDPGYTRNFPVLRLEDQAIIMKHHLSEKPQRSKVHRTPK